MPPVMGNGMLEPDAVKVACPVLKGLEAGNGLRLRVSPVFLLPRTLRNLRLTESVIFAQRTEKVK